MVGAARRKGTGSAPGDEQQMPSIFETSIALRPSLGTPHVLLLHPDPEQRKAWAATLSDALISSAEGWPEAIEILERDGVDVIVCPWPWAQSFSARLNREGDFRVVYVGSRIPDEVVEEAEAGNRVAFVTQANALAEKVLELTWPLRSQVDRHRPPALQMSCAALPGKSFKVLDVSSGGFSFVVPQAEALEALLPGTVLAGVTLRSAERDCLVDTRAEVRHLSLADSGYRVGCSLMPAARAGGDEAVLQDPVQCAALVRTALRRSGLRLRVEGGEAVRCRKGSVDPTRQEIRLPVRVQALTLFGVVRAEFELGGASYQFVTSVLELGEETVLRTPSTIEEHQRRRADRRVLPSPLPGRIRWALSEYDADCDVVDLSSSGCSVVISGNKIPVPPGVLVDRLRIPLESQVLTLRGRIVTSAPTGQGRIRCGVEFLGTTDEERLLLARFLVLKTMPGLADGNGASFDDVLALFTRVELLKPEYVEQLRPLFPTLRTTFERLGGIGDSLFRSLVVHHDDKLVGYVSAVRCHSRTWFVQQLAADPGPHRAPYLLNMGAAELFAQLTDIEYFKIAFFADNRWPARVFGRFARRISDPRHSILRAFYIATLHLEPTRHAYLEAPDVRVAEATAEQLPLVEQYFIRSRPNMLLSSDDLTKHQLTLAALDDRYRQAGLSRRRRVLVASQGAQAVAFALLDLSSPGYNLTEYFNAVRVHFLVPTERARRQVLRSVLLRRAGELFGEQGLAFARIFLRTDEQEEYGELGFAPGRRVLEWTCHRSRFRRFTEHVDRLFEALLARQRVREARAR